MSEDFVTGLGDLYDEAAAAQAGGSGFPTTAMAGRVRRNRRVRAIGVSAATVAVVVGVGIGGATVARLNDPVPAPPAESVTPSPSATRGAAEFTCGAVLDDLRGLDPTVVIETTLDAGSVPVGAPLTGRLSVVAVEPPGPAIDTSVPLGVSYAAVKDGVVVGLAPSSVDAGSLQQLSGRSGVTATTAIRLSPCPDDGVDGELQPGDYELNARMQVAEGSDAEPMVIGGGPWQFTITEAGMPLSAPGEHIPDSNASAIPPSSDPAVPLADGDYFGHLVGVDVTAGTVDVDIEIFYTGQAAIDYLTANDPTAENPPPNDYIIVNESTQLRTLTLAADVRVWDWCNETSGGTLGFAERDVAAWAAAPAGGELSCDAGAALSHGWNEVYWFQVRDAEVKQVIGQYLP